MKAVSVAIDSVHIDPANLRMHPVRNLDTIKASLARFGQQKPIVVDGNGIVRAGNGTLEAARALGWTKIDVVKTPLAGSEATAYSIADNRTAELAAWDDGRLGETLKALELEEFDIEQLGFNQDEVDALFAQLASETIEAVEHLEDVAVEDYLARGTRSLVFFFDEAEYEAVVSALEDYCQKHELETNTEAFIHLIEASGYSVLQSELPKS